MKLGFLEVLSSSDIREIHEASLDILSGQTRRCG